MESFRVSEIPIVRDKEYLGLISDKNIYDLDLTKICIKERNFTLSAPYVFVNQHIYEVIQKMLEHKVSVIPVLELNMDYCGSILLHELSEKYLSLVSGKDRGAIIVLEVNEYDYYLSQIAQIVESNNVKILSFYTHNNKNTKMVEITLKLNATDISSVIQTFVRYDYIIKAVYMDDSLLSNMYTDRYEQFMKYINI
jgi:CBS domain-containing protein